jgi:exopolyphosphatase/guanosine-5'-triphosphate,3'-diphosphate pyrophosphatase
MTRAGGRNGLGARTGAGYVEERRVARVSLARLRQTLGTLARLPAEERARRFGLRPDRADVIVPAAAIFEHVATRVRAKEIWVPYVGLVDGVLIDVARAAGAEGMKRLEISQTRHAAMALLRRYEADPRHSKRVSDLAVSLFEQLRPMHGLARRDGFLLELAALLHEVGNFIGPSGHHRHSYYIITQSPILGLTDEELLVVANVARYHRKAPPDMSHEGYRALAERDRQRVRTLAAILRVADALDHDHRQKVTRVQAKAHGSELRLRVSTRGDLSLDEWSVGNKGDLFREEFGLKPVVVSGG